MGPPDDYYTDETDCVWFFEVKRKTIYIYIYTPLEPEEGQNGSNAFWNVAKA
jgi:hypothetical protein